MQKDVIDIMLSKAYKALEADECVLTKVKNLLGESYGQVVAECVSGAEAEPYAVVCHSDSWTNNLLFRCDEVRSIFQLNFFLFYLVFINFRMENQLK